MSIFAAAYLDPPPKSPHYSRKLRQACVHVDIEIICFQPTNKAFVVAQLLSRLSDRDLQCSGGAKQQFSRSWFRTAVARIVGLLVGWLGIDIRYIWTIL